MGPKYKIIRFYLDPFKDKKIIAHGLTLEEAQKWCSDPETSSSTCTTFTGRDRTARYGEWFEGFEFQ